MPWPWPSVPAADITHNCVTCNSAFECLTCTIDFTGIHCDSCATSYVAIIIIKKATAASVASANAVANSALNASAEAKDIRVENLRETFDNNHSFDEMRHDLSESPSKTEGVNHSVKMPQDSKRSILQINERIVEEIFEWSFSVFGLGI
jgi:hypothetical protein